MAAVAATPRARVSKISIAPIKGLAVQRVDAVDVGLNGVTENRRLHLVDETGRFVNGKTSMQLSLVAARLDCEAASLALEFPEGDIVAGTIELGEPVETVFFGRPASGPLRAGTMGGRALAVVGARPAPRDVRRGRRGERSRARRGREHHLRGIGGRPRPHGRRRRAGLAALPHALRGRRRRSVRGGHLDRPRGPDRRRRRLPRRERRTLRGHHVRSGHGRSATSTRSACSRPTASDIETTEPLPLGVVGDVVTPGRVRVGDPVAPL